MGGCEMKHYTFVDYATQTYTLLVGFLILWCHNGTVQHWKLLAGLHGLIALGVHGLILTHFHRARKPLEFFRHFYPVLLFAYFFAETGWINRMFFSGYLDEPLIWFEQALFQFQPSALFMEKLPYLMISEVFYAAYFSYYLMIGGVGIALFFHNRQQFFHYVSVVSFVFYACYLVYIIFPIAGPPLFYKPIDGFNLTPALQHLAGNPVPEVIRGGVFYRLVTWIYEVFEAPGAAFPSSHVAVSWCATYFSFLPPTHSLLASGHDGPALAGHRLLPVSLRSGRSGGSRHLCRARALGQPTLLQHCPGNATRGATRPGYSAAGTSPVGEPPVYTRRFS